MQTGQRVNRRRAFLRGVAAAGLALAARPLPAAARPPVTRPVPASGERLPAIGMGTWLTFHVGQDHLQRSIRRDVLQAFFDAGGTVIDSSPMYGSAEEVLGDLLPRVQRAAPAFAATKVWTLGRQSGIEQMEASRRLWGVDRFDLMQVHNLLDWETHLPGILAMKAHGRVRYVGITTSHGRRHEDMLALMEAQPLDFVQFTYNIADREAEQRLLPAAAARGLAVICNRPFRGGALFGRVRGRPLPAWAAEFDCRNWAQFFLKFVISHPAVTCAIPATSRPDHMVENMGAGFGRLPDAADRQRMIDHFERL